MVEADTKILLLKNEKKSSVDTEESRSRFYSLTLDTPRNTRTSDGKQNSFCPTSRKELFFGTSICCIITLAIFLPILFCVIIPIIIQNVVDKSSISVIETNIVNPSNTKFQSIITQKFENTGSYKASIRMNSLKLYWDADSESQFCQLATLKSDDEFELSSDPVTISSSADVANIDCLTNFNLYVITAEKMKLEIKGSARVKSIVNTNVDIDKSLDMYGFNNFPNKPTVDQVNITSGLSNVLFSLITATFFSESTMSLTFGQDLLFEMSSYDSVSNNSYVIGIGNVPTALKYGELHFLSLVEMSYSNSAEQKQLMAVISNYTMGLDSVVTLGPFYLKEEVDWLRPALASIQLPTLLPGLKEKLIVSVAMYPNRLPIIVPFTMTLYNPIGVTFYLTKIVGRIYSNGVEIATVDQTVDIEIPPFAVITSPSLSANAVVSVAAYAEFTKLSDNGKGFVDVYSTITGRIELFPILITYNQFNVTTFVN